MSSNIIQNGILKRVAGRGLMDAALSATSRNGVQNRILKAKFDEIEGNISDLGDDVSANSQAITQLNSDLSWKSFAIIDTLNTPQSLPSVSYRELLFRGTIVLNDTIIDLPAIVVPKEVIDNTTSGNKKRNFYFSNYMSSSLYNYIVLVLGTNGKVQVADAKHNGISTSDIVCSIYYR